MKGYLNRPDLTAEVMRGDWYVTGDLATLDEDNFISITGRISRFSKIGGEMVPHLRVEAAIREVLAAGDEEVQLAVTAVHDPTRGERLVVLHTGLGMPAAGNLPPDGGPRHSAALDPLARQFPASGVHSPVGDGQARHVAVEGNGGAGVHPRKDSLNCLAEFCGPARTGCRRRRAVPRKFGAANYSPGLGRPWPRPSENGASPITAGSSAVKALPDFCRRAASRLAVRGLNAIYVLAVSASSQAR